MAYWPYSSLTRSTLTEHLIGLRMTDMIAFIRASPPLPAYFPEEQEIPACGREWVANMLQTLSPQEFSAWVRQAEQARRTRMDDKANRNVSSGSC